MFVVTIEHCQGFATGPSSSKVSGAELSLHIVILWLKTSLVERTVTGKFPAGRADSRDSEAPQHYCPVGAGRLAIANPSSGKPSEDGNIIQKIEFAESFALTADAATHPASFVVLGSA